jgi:hypothetical protein
LPLYGLKYDLPQELDATMLTFAFVVDRAPVAGSFYAKDGNNPTTYVYNDAGSGRWILRPDTTTVPAVPTPSAVAGGAMLACVIAGLRWLRRRQQL